MLAILFVIALSGFCVGWAMKRHDTVMLLVVSAASIVWLFLGYIVARSFYSGQSAALRTDGGMLTWEVTTTRGGSSQRGGISLRSIQMLELVFPRMRWQGRNYRAYQMADVFLVDVADRRHRIPRELWPGIYYKTILKAIHEVKPNVVLNEKFDDFDDVHEARE